MLRSLCCMKKLRLRVDKNLHPHNPGLHQLTRENVDVHLASSGVTSGQFTGTACWKYITRKISAHTHTAPSRKSKNAYNHYQGIQHWCDTHKYDWRHPLCCTNERCCPRASALASQQFCSGAIYKHDWGHHVLHAVDTTECILWLAGQAHTIRCSCSRNSKGTVPL